MMDLDVILEGDCLDLLRNIPDDSVDVTFADPPFNLGKKYNSYKDKRGLDLYLEWCREWIGELVRVTKLTGSIFIHNIPKWLTYYATFLNEIADFKHWIAWDAMSTPLGKSLMPAHYGILYYAKSKRDNKFYELRYPHKRCRKCGYLHKDYGGKKAGLHPFGPLVSDVWTDLHRIKHQTRRDEHPCQLPIHLLERVILMSTDAGDVVLDPFSGTGTTAIAAKQLGRHYIGLELDPQYVQISRQKLANTTSDSQVNGVWASQYLGQIVTLRDVDWDALEPCFQIPEMIEYLDFTPIQLDKSCNCHNQHSFIDDRQLSLFE
ncbi:MAG: restriction endonuclease [Phototrophicales bacterium]|nr:MAG: restriction endonuclease [Phototrophicales bacterium]